MKKLAFLFVALGLVLASFISKDKEIKYEKIYYKGVTVETDEATFLIDDAVSTEKVTKFKLKIKNKSTKYLIVKPEECTFRIEGKEYVPTAKKWEIVRPSDEENIVMEVKGSGFNKVKNYSFSLGGYYTMVESANPLSAPDFKLPASVNEFKVGDFIVTLEKVSKETDKTDARFACQYVGSKMGIVAPLQVAVLMPDGKEYAAHNKPGPFASMNAKVLRNGEKMKMALVWERMAGGKEMDMQLVDMFIKWHGTFSESEPVKASGVDFSLEFDEATSNAKGR